VERAAIRQKWEFRSHVAEFAVILLAVAQACSSREGDRTKWPSLLLSPMVTSAQSMPKATRPAPRWRRMRRVRPEVAFASGLFSVDEQRRNRLIKLQLLTKHTAAAATSRHTHDIRALTDGKRRYQQSVQCSSLCVVYCLKRTHTYV
jgi:hypothetical protein